MEIDRAVLDLDHDVRIELAVQRNKIVVRGPGAIVLRIVPIHVMVVDEAAIKNQSSVRLQRARHHVGRVRMRASVSRGPHAALRIGFHHHSRQIRHSGVKFIHLGFPPGGDAWVKRIERI